MYSYCYFFMHSPLLQWCEWFGDCSVLGETIVKCSVKCHDRSVLGDAIAKCFVKCHNIQMLNEGNTALFFLILKLKSELHKLF